MSDRVTVSFDGHLAIVSLNNPDRLNVLDRKGWEALANNMTTLSEDAGVHCVVIEGTGDRAFSAGSDIGEFPEGRQTPEQVQAYGRALESALVAVRGCPVTSRNVTPFACRAVRTQPRTVAVPPAGSRANI